MNYLIQAYACSSVQGGEYAVSWGWITHLSNAIGKKDRIYVVSLTLQQKEIDDNGIKNVRVLNVNGMEKYKFLKYNQMYYMIWQYKAYNMIKKMKLNIDVVHVYSLSDFRFPGKWYKMRNTYTIFGPVGGGQICPTALQEYDDKSGKIREKINKIWKHNVFFKYKIKKYNRVYACNKETKKYLKDSTILTDVPINDMFRNIEIKRSKHEIITILFVGRLINKKGLRLLLDALEYIDSNVAYQVLIYGEGNQYDSLKEIIKERGLEEKVFLKGKVSYNDISDVYMNGDIFVLPSLRESGGIVLIEALAHKLPIIALDMSLANLLNKYKCGLFVNTDQTKKKILCEFGDALSKLIKNSDIRMEYGNNGYKYVNENLTWNKMIKEVYGEFI